MLNIEKERCYGCGACRSACTRGAIVMEADEEGFLYPSVDTSLCDNCGQCVHACPVVNKSEAYFHNERKPTCYALMADDQTRLHSTAGGAFTLFANAILEQGGVVCGAAFDGGSTVKHILVDNKEDLKRLRGSKYVQSNTDGVYDEVKRLLDSGRMVLFSGTPCQVAGLNVFLGRRYERLYTIDVVCHGVPSQKVFDMYLDEMGMKNDFVSTNFWDKICGWGIYNFTSVSKNKIISNYAGQDTYFEAYTKNMCSRPVCSTCPFITPQRESDITLANFWHIEKVDETLNDKLGTSAILLNSEKGKLLFDGLEDNILIKKEIKLRHAWFLYTVAQVHPNRVGFFRMISQGKSFAEAVNYCNHNEYDCAILTFWYSKNCGGMLTSYALQQAINALGYTSKIIKFDRNNDENFETTNSALFARKYLDMTERLDKVKDFSKLNSQTSTFIMGSDCLWSKAYHKPHLSHYNYYLSFANLYAKRIAYATSMATYAENLENLTQSEESYRLKYYFEQFDRISLREKDGVDYFKRKFNMDIDQNPDPVFLIDKQKYNDIIESSTLDIQEDFILLYSKNSNPKIDSFVESIRKKVDLPVHNLTLHDGDVLTEDWLYSIKRCKLLVTHSFHGLCFALIFNKPFIVWKVPGFDDSRPMSLLKTVGLENRLLVDIETIDQRSDLFEPIDWDRVNAILAKEKERGLKWLKEALQAPKDYSKVSPAAAVIKSLDEKVLDLRAQVAGVKKLSEAVQGLKVENQRLRAATAATRKLSDDMLRLMVVQREVGMHRRRCSLYKFISRVTFGKLRQKMEAKARQYQAKMEAATRLNEKIKALFASK